MARIACDQKIRAWFIALTLVSFAPGVAIARSPSTSRAVRATSAHKLVWNGP